MWYAGLDETRVDTIDCPDDEHLIARNMYRTGINNYKKIELCVKLFIYKKTTKSLLLDFKLSPCSEYIMFSFG